MKPTDNRAVAYIRVSTKRQHAEGYSPEDQREAIAAYAKTNGLEILKWFEEAKSAYNRLDDRTAYHAMCSFIAENNITNVIYKFTDRATRNMPHLVQLESFGINIHNLERGHGFNPADPDDYQDTADEERRAVAAKEESARTRKKVKDATALMVRGFT